MYRLLLSNSTFKELNIPIPASARRELENSIRKGLHLEPIYIWKDYILTGYEQDDLCLKYHRPFSTKEMFFSHKSDAIAWICHQQLKRTDLIWTARSWLIFRLYEALRESEKRQTAREEFQYKQLSPSIRAVVNIESPKESTTILNQLAEEFNYHKETIRRYVYFGRQLDRLEETIPGIRTRILTGDLEVMIRHMPALLKMPVDLLRKMTEDKHCKKLIPPRELIIEGNETKQIRHRTMVHVQPGIKQMPAYDPDAELNGLTYTIGAWIKAITRTSENADLNHATKDGKERLRHALITLKLETESLNRMLEANRNE